MVRTKVYISSSVPNLKEVREYEFIHREEYDIISSWHEDGPEIGYDGDERRLRTAATVDFAEISFCDEVHCLDAPGSGGGMYAELGYALALGKRVIIFGEKRNSLIHFHPGVEFVVS